MLIWCEMIGASLSLFKMVPVGGAVVSQIVPAHLWRISWRGSSTDVCAQPVQRFDAVVGDQSVAIRWDVEEEANSSRLAIGKLSGQGVI